LIWSAAIDLSPEELEQASRLNVLLGHLSVIDDDLKPHRFAYPLQESLFLSVCGTIAKCDDYDDIAAWGAAHLDFLRRFLLDDSACRPAAGGRR